MWSSPIPTGTKTQICSPLFVTQKVTYVVFVVEVESHEFFAGTEGKLKIQLIKRTEHQSKIKVQTSNQNRCDNVTICFTFANIEFCHQFRGEEPLHSDGSMCCCSEEHSVSPGAQKSGLILQLYINIGVVCYVFNSTTVCPMCFIFSLVVDSNCSRWIVAVSWVFIVPAVYFVKSPPYSGSIGVGLWSTFYTLIGSNCSSLGEVRLLLHLICHQFRRYCQGAIHITANRWVLVSVSCFIQRPIYIGCRLFQSDDTIRRVSQLPIGPTTQCSNYEVSKGSVFGLVQHSSQFAWTSCCPLHTSKIQRFWNVKWNCKAGIYQLASVTSEAVVASIEYQYNLNSRRLCCVMYVCNLQATRQKVHLAGFGSVSNQQSFPCLRMCCTMSCEVKPQGAPHSNFTCCLFDCLKNTLGTSAFQVVDVAHGDAAGVDQPALEGFGVSGGVGDIRQKGVVLQAHHNRSIGGRGGLGAQRLVDVRPLPSESIACQAERKHNTQQPPHSYLRAGVYHRPQMQGPSLPRSRRVAMIWVRG
jgi:hypothetical protein